MTLPAECLRVCHYTTNPPRRQRLQWFLEASPATQQSLTSNDIKDGWGRRNSHLLHAWVKTDLFSLHMLLMTPHVAWHCHACRGCLIVVSWDWHVNLGLDLCKGYPSVHHGCGKKSDGEKEEIIPVILFRFLWIVRTSAFRQDYTLICGK